MAQIPKQRLALYIVIAVVVLAVGIWFFVQAQKQKRVMSGMRIRPHQVARLTTSLRRELRAASRRTENIAEAPELIGRIEAGIAEFAAQANPADSTVSEELTQKYNEINGLLRDLRRLKKGTRE